MAQRTDRRNFSPTPPDSDSPCLRRGGVSLRAPAPGRAWLVSALALWLVACGGGGGGDSGSSTGGGVVPVANPVEPVKPPLVTAITGADAGRLAEQATFGPTPAVLASIQARGSGWIDDQIIASASSYSVLQAISTNASATCPPTGSSTCFRDKYTAFPIQLQFFQNALNNPDQLRQRVALAYSQIFVVSSSTLMPAYALRNYQQVLLDGAFGNFRQLLTDITLNPTMGSFLNMVNNDKGDDAARVTPNENYARELLQLFSIGPTLLEPDGTPTLRGGQRVPAYTQATVEGFAKVFTGWTYPSPSGDAAASRNNRTPWFNGPMIPVASQHDTGSKTLLNGVVLPAGGTAQSDLAGALDNIFKHPNVGPFIGKQLIQFLVTSNPSPGYVGRVAAVFNDDGKGVRGNMGAVVKAILMDPDARGNSAPDVRFGKLREPVVDVVAVLRALNARSDGEYPNYVAYLMGQPLFGASTVFNFYPPNFPLPMSSSMVAPQFGILNTSSASARLNFISAVVYAPSGLVFAADPTVAGAIGTTVDLSTYAAAAGGTVDSLVQRLNNDLLHGGLSSAEATTVATAVNAIPATAPQLALERARSATYLVLASPRYQVTR